jgi:hypothetical protein
VVDVITGELTKQVPEFAVQYSDVSGNPYTSYYSITNPTPLYDEANWSVNFFDYNVCG